MIELFDIVLTKGIEWGVGKALDVIWTCCTCSERKENGKIKNTSHNILECPNCHKTIKQFTNACETTVQSNGFISHVGLEYGVASPYQSKWSWREFRRAPPCSKLPYTVLSVGLPHKQLVTTTVISEYSSGIILYRNSIVMDIIENRQRNNVIFEVPILDLSPCFSNYYQYNKQHPSSAALGVLAADTSIETRYKEILTTERAVIQQPGDFVVTPKLPPTSPAMIVR